LVYARGCIAQRDRTHLMNILLVGGGGREHALAWKIAQSPRVETLVCAPGNAGIAELAECVAVAADDVDALCALAEQRKVDLVVVGPEAPLVEGLADRLSDLGVAVFGPSRDAARLEASKAFTKEICAAVDAPTAAYGDFTDADAAKGFLDTLEAPYVLKADGLAAGKGVVIAHTREEAEREIDAMLSGRFGAASRRLVIEEFMPGEEASLFALCDGEEVVFFGGGQDHKRAFDGDEGPNTGGMGVYAPAPILSEAVVDAAMNRIVRPTIIEMRRRGTPFRGVLYAGLMIDKGQPRLVEYNVRFGDPECQVLMLRLGSDIVPYLAACAGLGRLGDLPAPQWRTDAAVTVVMAANGYPGAYRKGSRIDGLLLAESAPGVTVFHAGTTRDRYGVTRASGGRVLNVCGFGGDLRAAAARAYEAVDLIDWPDGFCRRDIAARAL